MLSPEEEIELEALLIRERSDELRESFLKFFCEFWDVINQDELYLNFNIKYICDEMQIIFEKMILHNKMSNEDKIKLGDLENDDMLANVPPGSSKSTILSQMSLAWVWTKMPNCIGIFSTIAQKNADDFSIKFRDLVTSEKYRLYFPEIILRRDSAALSTIRNTLGGARLQYTTHGRKTGMHGHFLAIDDNMAFADAQSDQEAERCNEALKGLMTREKKNTRVPKFFFMQMQSKIDTTQWVLKRFPKIKRIVLPAIDNGKIEPPHLRDFYIDGYFNPFHMGKEFLENKKLQLSAEGFGDIQYLAEYMQDCESSEGAMYLINRVEEMPKKGITIAVCDPADDGDCYLATVFAYIHSNKVWVRDIIYTQDSEEDKTDIQGNITKIGTISRNVAMAKEYQPYAFYIEKDGLGNGYGKQVKAKYGLVVPYNAKGDKDLRIHARSSIVNRHFVFLQQSPSIEYENAVNHLTGYKKVGKNKYKDIEDALTSLADIAVKNNLINIYI